MISLSFLSTKSIGIFGLGKTGAACAKAIMPYADRVFCWDDNEKARVNFQHQELLFSYESWQDLDYIVVSPGISHSHPIFQVKSSIVSDIDLLYMAHHSKCYIGVTGTNGKSTTTALIGHILSEHNKGFEVGGNIGIPALELNDNSQGFVLELSSFQLDLTKRFQADIAVLLNLSNDHLDRYESMEQYLNSKLKLIKSAKYGIIGVDDEYTSKAYERLDHDNLIPISSSRVLNYGVSVIDDMIYCNLEKQFSRKIPNNKYLQGIHNKQNIAAAFACCLIQGMKISDIIKSIESFVGLPHRMQFVHEHNGIFFYNDSKATNPEAASKSISTLKNIYLLAGGIAKTNNISPLLPYIQNIKHVYLYGVDKDILLEAFKEHVQSSKFDTLDLALKQAISDSLKDHSPQKNILLAPLCSSYDQFKNFEERGEFFSSLARNYSEFRQDYGI